MRKAGSSACPEGDGRRPADRREIAAWRRQSARGCDGGAPGAGGAAASARQPRLRSTGWKRDFRTSPARLVGFYWPIRRELDPLPFIRRCIAAGGDGRLAGGRGQRASRSSSGCGNRRMKMATGRLRHSLSRRGRGRFARGAASCRWSASTKPAIGWAMAAAIYDRTLASFAEKAALHRRRLRVGAPGDSIQPQPHDMPMDFIVTEETAARRAGDRLEVL